ncbi:MAG: Mammalian cell entry related domain protein [Solirubrobacterales bacterium]|nr:Mammalian cell entry related domain protein [Solirubrobacterales bacterium]
MRTRPGRTTRRRDTPPPVSTAVGGIAVVILLAILGWQALRVYNGVPLRNYSTVYVSTPQVGNLLSHDPVRIAGARVGQVLKRDVGTDGRPRIQLQIEPGTSLPADTHVAVRGAGLLGARYVELIPGRSTQPIADGATITGTPASYTYGLPETLDTFDAQTRGGLSDMVGGLGQGFFTNGAPLNDSIHAIGTRAAKFGVFSRKVLKREGAAGRLLPALDAAVAPLDANRERLGAAMPQLSGALEPFIVKRKDLRETLDVAPPTLAALRPDLAEGTRLLASVRRAATAATRTLPGAPAGLHSLTALLKAAPVPLDRTNQLLKAVPAAVPGALRITSAVRPVLTPLRNLLTSASDPLHTVARYSCDVVNFGETMRSMTGFAQPGPDGPIGKAQAFRLQLLLPISAEPLGVKDTSGLLRRETMDQVTPCKYLAKPYPQFDGGTGR